MKRVYVWLSILALASFLLFACGENPPGASNPRGDCPEGKGKTTAPGICLPNAWPADSQLDRTDGGFVITERLLSPAEKEIVNRQVIAGIADMIANVRRHNPSWGSYIESGPYQVVMINKMATNQDGTPALLVGGIQTAGTVINVAYADRQRHGAPIMVLPLPDDATAPGYANYLYWSAYNEGEHYFEHENDLQIFWRFVGAGDSHPHWQIMTPQGLKGGRESEQAHGGALSARDHIEPNADAKNVYNLAPSPRGK